MTGLIEFWGLAAADGSSPSYQGIITGGRHQIPSAVIEERGIGSYKPFQTTPGLLTPGGSVDFIVQDKTIIEKAVRTAGALTEFGVSCGDTAWDALYKNCLCSSLTLRCSQGDRLQGSFAWLAKTAVEGSGAQTQTAAADVPLLWNAFAITGLTGLTIESFEMTIRHNLEQRAVLETPSAGVKRFPKYVHDTGQDMVSLNLTLLAQGGSDITTDALAEIATITLAFTGTSTLTLTLTGVEYAEKNDDFTPNAMATKGINLLCDDLAVTYA